MEQKYPNQSQWLYFKILLNKVTTSMNLDEIWIDGNMVLCGICNENEKKVEHFFYGARFRQPYRPNFIIG